MHLKRLKQITALIWIFALALVSLLSVQASQAGTVFIDGQETTATIERLELKSGPACAETFCDADDLNCDGVLDQGCPGLTYDICEDGSIVDSYIAAAFSGICLADPPDPCTGLTLGGFCKVGE